MIFRLFKLEEYFHVKLGENLQFIFDEESRQLERILHRQDTNNLVDQISIYKYDGDLFSDSLYLKACNSECSGSTLPLYFSYAIGLK